MTEVYTFIDQPNLYLPPQYGLLSAVNWLTPTDPHWAGGIQYDVNCAEVNVTLSPCVSGAPVTGWAKVPTWDRATRGARAFTVYGEAECSPAGSDWWTAGESDSLRVLTQAGSTQVERTFWTGVGVGAPGGGSAPRVFPNLTASGPIFDETNRIILQPSSVLATGVASDVIQGLGLLESLFTQCYDGYGVIHVPYRLGAPLAAAGLIRIERGQLYTLTGQRVVLGYGYPDTYGPNGTPVTVGASWIFMTSPIFGLRGTPRVTGPVDSLDRSVNTVKFIAEQTFLLAWECCLVGVQTSMTSGLQ